MPVHHATARKLATGTEWALVQASYGHRITALTPARLKQKVARARKLRDKYRDRARQQRGEARGKRGARATRAAQGNANTVIKRRMFAEALERFETRLAYLMTTTARDAARGAKTAKRRARRPKGKIEPMVPPQEAGDPWVADEAAAMTAARAHSAESRGTRKQQKLLHQSALAHQGHVGSRGRRNQARRDAR